MIREYFFLCEGFLYSVANVATKTAVKVKDAVKETVEGKDILKDFNKEQEKFVNEKHNKRKGNTCEIL